LFVFFKKCKKERKSSNKMDFANEDSRTRQICQPKMSLCRIGQIRQKLGNQSEIFFARHQTTFKSTRIFEIWRRKLPSGNAEKLLPPPLL
jgi:DNA-binding transcriptional regulator YiaG